MNRQKQLAWIEEQREQLRNERDHETEYATGYYNGMEIAYRKAMSAIMAGEFEE